MIKRVSMSLLAIGLISLLITAGSVALFTAKTENVNNTFTAGKVTLGAPVSTLVSVDKIVPGDTGHQTFDVEYTGNVQAFLGLDTALSGALITCDSGGKFVVGISDGTHSYSANAADQLIGKADPGFDLSLAVDWELKLAAGNDCQGDSAQLSLLVKAVQVRNNEAAGAPISWN